LSLREIFLSKIRNFAIFSDFYKIGAREESQVRTLTPNFTVVTLTMWAYIPPNRPHFYTHNVKINVRERTDLQFINDRKFRQNRSRGLPVLDCPAEMMQIDF